MSRFSRYAGTCSGLGIALLLAGACTRSTPRTTVYPTPVYTAQPGYAAAPPPYAPAPGYGAPPPAYAPGYAPAPAPAPAPPSAPAPVPAPQAPQASVPAPLPPVVSDPINLVNLSFLRAQAQAVLSELVRNLPAAQQSRVQGIPLIVDDEVGEVNAFAACSASGRAAMAISDGLLEIQAHLAQAQALDELFGSRKVDEYIRFIAQHQRPKAPIVRPPAGFFDPGQSIDGRKVQRQHQILEEQLAFVLGHELAHHYLGHLPCTAGPFLNSADVLRVLSDAVPSFNQPNELAADTQGVNNLLTTGARRGNTAYRFSEAGALLTMRFFSGMDQFSASDILFGFERSHPPPLIRTPVIQQTATMWRSTGGQGLPIIAF